MLYIPGFPGVHSQAETLDELHKNLVEVVTLLLQDGEPKSCENKFLDNSNSTVTVL